MERQRGVVLFGDVVGSRDGPSMATGWLDELCRTLDADYGPRRLAAFEFTQGDEIQGLLAVDADPFGAILSAMLQPHEGEDARPLMRWVAVLGTVDAGRGPTTHRTGDAFVQARALLREARNDRDGLRCQTGDPAADAYLAGTTPVLAAIIDRMTDRQRQIARLALVDGLRQSEIADRLAIARPTVSVSHARADIPNVTRLVASIRAIWMDGVARSIAHAEPASAAGDRA
jgi:DNA-binding CsgD family transcriptional regulator